MACYSLQCGTMLSDHRFKTVFLLMLKFMKKKIERKNCVDTMIASNDRRIGLYRLTYFARFFFLPCVCCLSWLAKQLIYGISIVASLLIIYTYEKQIGKRKILHTKLSISINPNYAY